MSVLVKCWSYRVGCTHEIAKPHWHCTLILDLLASHLQIWWPKCLQALFFVVKYRRKFRAILMSLLEKSCLNCPATGRHPWSKSLLQCHWSLIKTSGSDIVHQTCGFSFFNHYWLRFVSRMVTLLKRNKTRKNKQNKVNLMLLKMIM